MSRWFPILALTLAVFLPLTASAKEKKKKPLALEPLAEEVRAHTGAELTKDQLKALRVASRCLDDDQFWAREMENREPVTQTYETLSGAVVCWQGAEKKASKLDDSFGSVLGYIRARARYVEVLRSFYFSLTEKLRTGADIGRLCERLNTTLEQAAAANDAGAGLAESFQTPNAQALAAQLDADIAYWGELVANEHKHQKCK